MRTADYKLQTPKTKKHSEEHWCKSNVSEVGEGTAASNEDSKPTTENTETKQVLRLMEKFWFEGAPFTLGVKAEIEKNNRLNVPEVINKC
jgi:hypothetical protein